MTPTLTIATPTDTEIVMTRLFEAPAELVFEAMTRAEHVRQWWGWSSWTMTVCEADVRPGGTYRYVSRGPNGEEVPFTGTYLEVEPPERIVFTEIYDVAPYNQGEPAVATTRFVDVGGATEVTITSRYPSRAIRDAVLQSGMEAGAAHSYDRLGELLKRLS